VSGSKDSTVKVWRLQESKWKKGANFSVHTLAEHKKAVCSLHWKDKLLVTGGKDRVAKMWDLDTNTCVRSLHGKSVIYALKFNDSLLATGTIPSGD
jgi:WD40 repeat protein